MLGSTTAVLKFPNRQGRARKRQCTKRNFRGWGDWLYGNLPTRFEIRRFRPEINDVRLEYYTSPYINQEEN
jgi:hypothetical protein